MSGQVESQACAYYVTQFAYKSEKSVNLTFRWALYLYQTTDGCPLEKTKPLLLCSTSAQMCNHHSDHFDFQTVTQEYIETARHIVQSVFLQRSTLKLSTHSHICLFGGKSSSGA